MGIKVSVILGVYNPKEEDLNKAVRSIIEQTFKEWELILYDDGSEKGAAERIRKLSQLDERIRWIRNEKNHGLAYALNQCMKLAEGKYIARMDADDLSKPERLEKQYRFLEGHPEFLWVGTNAGLFDRKGVWGCERMPEVPISEDFLKYSPYIHPSVMFRKKELRQNGYRVSKLTRRCEDYELFMRLHAQGFKGYNLQENLFLYREEKESYKKRKIRFRVYEMMIRYQGFKRLHILTPATMPYVLRPLAGGLPGASHIRRILRRRRDANLVKDRKK